MNYQTLFFAVVPVLTICLAIAIAIAFQRQKRIDRMVGQISKLRAAVIEEVTVAIYAGVTRNADIFRFQTEEGPDGETFFRVFLKRPSEDVKLLEVFVPADIVSEEIKRFFPGKGPAMGVCIYELDPVLDGIESFLKETATKTRGAL